MKMFNVVVAGGEEFNNYELLSERLDLLLSKRTEYVVIVTTFENGVASEAARYGRNNSIVVANIPAHYEEHGNKADIMRNYEMINLADAVVCFSNGKSEITNHLIASAKEYATPIRVINY